MSPRIPKVKISQTAYDRLKTMELALNASEEKIVAEAINLYYAQNGERIRKFFERLDQGSALFKKPEEPQEFQNNGISEKE